MSISVRALKSWAFLATVLAVNLLAVLYFQFSRNVYFWDNAGYWQLSAYLSDLVFTRPLFFIRQVLSSVLTQDYNYIPATPIAIFMAIFGTSRISFTLAVVNLYLVPLYALIRMVTTTRRYIITVLMLPMLPFLAIIGFLDVGGVALAFGAMVLYLHEWPKHGNKFAVLAGFLLFGVTVFRRWFIFFTIAFCVAVLVHAIYTKKIKRMLWGMLGFGVPMLIFHRFVFNILLGANYAYIYSAYRFPLSVDLLFTLFYFGLIPLVMIFACIRRKNLTALFGALVCVLTYPLFLLIQSFGQQHFLLFAAPLALIIVGTEEIRQLKRAHIALALAIVTFLSPFVPQARFWHPRDIDRVSIFPAFNPYPGVRQDAEALMELANFVIDLEGPTVVLASSFVLNPDLLNNAIPSLNARAPFVGIDNLLWIQQVDRRDGVPYSILEADYVITTVPTALHLAPDEQLVVSMPNEAMLADTPFSAAFRRLDRTFQLQGDLTVYVFERTRPNTAEEIDWLFDSIRAAWVIRDS